MKNRTLLIVLNIVALISTLVMNFFSQRPSAIPGLTAIFPYSTQELGESRAIFFLPAGYVFAIWGVIYLGLIAFAIFQAQPRARDSQTVEKVGVWFIVSCLANIVWLLLFQNNQVWASTIAMIVLLVSLLMIYTRLGIGRTPVSTAVKWMTHIPFSIYLGWITVATVANFSAALYVSGNIVSFLGISADVWAVIMMIVAAAITFAMLYLRRDAAYAFVVVWALIGINARSFETDLFIREVGSLNAALVDTSALIVAVVVAIGALAALFLRASSSARTT